VERDIARDNVAHSEDFKNYLLQLFKIAGEHRSEPVTVQSLLDQQLQRTVAAPDAPESLAMERMLGELFIAANDDASAENVLNRYLQSAPAGTAPEDLASAHASLALMEMHRGRAPEAAQQLAAAHTLWDAHPDRYREELLASRYTEASVLQAQGHRDEGARLLQDAVAQAETLYGPRDLRTATLYNDLSTAQFADAHIPEARKAARKAWAILNTLGRQHGTEGLDVLNNLAVLAYRADDNTEAEQDYQLAIELRRQLYGPSSGLAALLHNYGKLLTEEGKAAQALPLLQEAVTLSARYSGENSYLHAACEISTVKALVDLKDFKDAEPHASAALDASRATFGEHHAATAMAELRVAELRYAEGRTADGDALIETAEGNLRALGPSVQSALTAAAKLREHYGRPPAADQVANPSS